jgi:adenosylhomocysteine nucleosidase
MSVPAIIAALPREVAGLVKGVRPDPIARRAGIYTYVLPRCIIVCAGMGATRATLAVEKALQLADISCFTSVGLAGACHSGIKIGSVVEVRTVIDALTGEHSRAGDDAKGTLVTTAAIASVKEKERLHQSYGADVVDMEGATVARLATIHGLRFRAFKAVSDGHDFELASMSRFASPHGHFRTGAFALHTALRPHHWRKTVQLGANSQRALTNLTKILKELYG